MPRQKKTRTIENPPIYDGYKPLGISTKHIDYVDLRLEEYEAIRLADYVNLRQEEAALRMNISRPTFTRIYNSARKKIAQAFVEGKMLLFKGGDINIDQHWFKCKDCSEIFKLNEDENPICTTCSSSNIENLKENINIWHEEQASSTSEKIDLTCVSCGYKLRTNKKGLSCPQCGNRMNKSNKDSLNKLKKVAIPIDKNRLCNHFGGAKFFDIYHIENNQVLKQETLKAPKHEPGVLPNWLKTLNVSDVIAGGMGQRAIKLLEHNNIRTHTGVQEDSIERILNKFLNGTLELGPSVCSHNKEHNEDNHKCGNH